ncbi:MAG: hypothetical protein SGILL_005776, partial [Bacillariaceae sp.]
TAKDFEEWRRAVRKSAMAKPESLQEMDLKEGAPFLDSVSPMADHLVLEALPWTDALPKSPRDSMLQCTYPLSTDLLLRNSVTDLTNWSSFRLGKFYETVDALTADVAYRHCSHFDGNDDTDIGLVLVTGGHYNSRKFCRTNIDNDAILRSYLTSTGTSSMEIRTDAIQIDDDTGKEILVNVCHTVMVALDAKSGKPLSRVGRSVPSLTIQNEGDKRRLELAQIHNNIRKDRGASTMQLRSPVSNPPTAEEMETLHQQHRQRRLNPNEEHPCVKDFTFRSSTVIFPENRNVHGKLFGGYIMEEAQSLAQYAAAFLSKGKPVFPIGIDEAVFLQPIAIGDTVTFTARVVHCTTHTCRVLVQVEVRDPTNRDSDPVRSNRLMFIFGGSNFPPSILPESYPEIIMSIDARRRHRIEGPTEEFVELVINEASSMARPKSMDRGLSSTSVASPQQRAFSSSSHGLLPPEEQAINFLVEIGHDDPGIAQGVVEALKGSGISGPALVSMVKAMAGRWEVGEDAGLEPLVEAVRVNLLKDEGRTRITLFVIPANAWKSSEEDAEDYANITETPEERDEALKRAFSVKAMTGLTLTDVAKFGEGAGASHLGESIECACAGIMACSTCHVVIDPEWYDNGVVEKPSESEVDMLDLAYAPRNSSRLACQIVLDDSMDGMVIRLPKGANNLMDFVPFSE